MRTVVLVEGESDRVALLALAGQLGRDLTGVEVRPLSGVTNLRTALVGLDPGQRVAGLYDAPEEHVVRRALTAAGRLADGADRSGLRAAGFFACEPDLEGELLRALGTAGAEAVVVAGGDGRSLALLAQMPAQRGWSREAVLRRFLTAGSGRKARYAASFAGAVALDRAPEPLTALLDHVARR